MKSHGVLSAAIGLVAAVGLALLISRTSAPPASSGVTDVRDFGDVPGFRADLWYLPDDSVVGFVEVEPGPFLMGSDPARDRGAFDTEIWSRGESPGTVEQRRFFIGRYEVTVAQYAAFVAATGTAVPDPATLRGRADFPVVAVAWTDAVSYARWLDQMLRESPETPTEIALRLEEGWRVVIPTEAQWEKAARGTDGRIYPWGDEPRPDRANYLSSSPTRVGTYGCLECPFEAYDLAGNVWEWTRSPFQPYPYDESDDLEASDDDAFYVIKGGSFSDGANLMRNAVRIQADPGARRPNIGFRVALSPS